MKSIIIICFSVTLYCSAQSIPKSVINNGGGDVSNGTYQLTFSIGEPNIGSLDNNLKVDLGFLSTLANSSNLSTNTPEASAELSYYPNPVVNELHFNLSGLGKTLNLSIYNLSGQFVKQLSITAQNPKANLTALATGTYMVVAQDTDKQKQYVFKIIKK